MSAAGTAPMWRESTDIVALSPSTQTWPLGTTTRPARVSSKRGWSSIVSPSYARHKQLSAIYEAFALPIRTSARMRLMTLEPSPRVGDRSSTTSPRW
jgi:hypothetical protein